MGKFVNARNFFLPKWGVFRGGTAATNNMQNRAPHDKNQLDSFSFLSVGQIKTPIYVNKPCTSNPPIYEQSLKEDMKHASGAKGVATVSIVRAHCLTDIIMALLMMAIEDPHYGWFVNVSYPQFVFPVWCSFWKGMDACNLCQGTFCH